jgi:hypothetical protein
MIESDLPVQAVCSFCHLTTVLDDAAGEAAWLPSYWSPEDIEAPRPVCPDCWGKYLTLQEGTGNFKLEFPVEVEWQGQTYKATGTKGTRYGYGRWMEYSDGTKTVWCYRIEGRNIIVEDNQNIVIEDN